MFRISVCYDNSCLELEKNLKDLVSNSDIEFESFNEELYTDRKKSFKVKGHFAARQTPFVGVFKDTKGIKGFYSEANECTIDKVTTYLQEARILDHKKESV